jgi:hypothetical protein
MGIIPPLYFTAMKCRVLTIRRAAIRLLERTMPRREGIWIADVSVVIARRLVEIEEQGLDEDGEMLPLEEKRVVDVLIQTRVEKELTERVQGLRLL